MACSSCGRAAASRAGNSPTNAIVFGEPTSQAVRVRVTGSVAGLQQGAIKYVRGSGVDQLVADGSIDVLAGAPRVLTAAQANQRLYYVGDVGYATMDGARVRSGQVGEDIIVRSFG